MKRKLILELLESRNLLAGLVPLAFNDSYSVGADTELSVPAAGVLSNDTDAESDALSAVLFQSTSNGTLLLESDGSFVYQPNVDFSGSDVFLYRANDGESSSKLAAVTIKVIGPAINGIPFAENDSYSVDEDGVLDVGAAHGTLANDSDPEGGLFAELVSSTTNGILELDADGSFIYTPDADFNGSDEFVYAANDGESASEATVELLVNAVNDAPVAVNDEYATDEDTILAVDAILGVLGNDTDIDGDTLEAFLLTGPDNGTLVLSPDGSFTYEPDADSNGFDAFTYFASDGTISSDAAVVELSINAVNDSPVANNDHYEAAEDVALVLDPSGILTNDTDIDSPVLVPVLFTGPSHGTLILNDDGSLTYTPNLNFNGIDSFLYQAFDGESYSELAVVEILVSPVNDAPESFNESYNVAGSIIVDPPGIIGNDTDVDGDILSAILFVGPFHGTLALNSDGSFSYTADEGYVGLDAIVYEVTDGALTSYLAVTTLHVGLA